MENNKFNLLNQLTQEQKSLWRIDNMYLNDAQTEDEKWLWNSLKEQKAQAIQQLETMIKSLM